MENLDYQPSVARLEAYIEYLEKTGSDWKGQPGLKEDETRAVNGHLKSLELLKEILVWLKKQPDTPELWASACIAAEYILGVSLLGKSQLFYQIAVQQSVAMLQHVHEQTEPKKTTSVPDSLVEVIKQALQKANDKKTGPSLN